MKQTIEERAREYFRPKWRGSIIDAYIAGATEQDRIARQEEREKAKEAFCMATCKGKLHRSTCTSLGTCEEYDEFCAIIRKAIEGGEV